MHLPPLQTSPVAQTVLQSPQCNGSFCVSAQLPPHIAYPLLQTNPHLELAQVGLACAGASHVTLQPPQLAGSVRVSMQVAPQSM